MAAFSGALPPTLKKGMKLKQITPFRTGSPQPKARTWEPELERWVIQ